MSDKVRYAREDPGITAAFFFSEAKLFVNGCKPFGAQMLRQGLFLNGVSGAALLTGLFFHTSHIYIGGKLYDIYYVEI